MHGAGRRAWLALPFLVGATIACAACGSSSAGSGGSASAAATSVATVNSGPSALSSLPASLRSAYANSGQTDGVSPYKNFKPKGKPPWTIGYSSTYAGNTWRAIALSTLEKAYAKYKRAGLVKNFVVMQSNNNVSVQIQQIHQMISEGVNIILTCAPLPGVNGAIKDAYEHGIPVISFNAAVQSPYAINIGANFYRAGAQEAAAMVSQLHGKGNVLLMSGLDGVPESDLYDAGAISTLKAAAPGINYVGQVQGQWTDSIAKSQTLQFLATHPQPLNGVVAQSANELGVLEALQQSGRPLVPVTLAGEASAACYWRNHPNFVNEGFSIWPPEGDPGGAFDVAMRVLEGQGVKIESIVRDEIPFNYSALKAALPASCSQNSTNWLEIGLNKWWPDSLLNNFFVHPANPLDYKAA